MLGQSFFIGFAGLELPASVEKFIRENNIGGVTLFANNYESPAQVAELVNQIQRCNPETPLFIGVDHEGGRVQRFRKGFTRFPEARLIGDQDSPKLAYECAQIMGTELKAVGVNLVFAPVVDINTNPKNPVIGRRSFGETEERVSKVSSGYVRGFLNAGVQPVLKHFPGHGDTSQDSHFHLPTVRTSLETLRDRELKPFLKGFKAHANFVMSAHIIVEAVEPKLPGTLSKKILQGLLREELRFKGIIISDDMEMKAIADHFGSVDAACMALEAGVNVLLYHTEPFQNEVWDPLLTKLTSPSGKQALVGLQDSAKRLAVAKRDYLNKSQLVDIPAVEKLVGIDTHLALAKRLEEMDTKS